MQYDNEEDLITAALGIMEDRLRHPGEVLNCSETAQKFVWGRMVGYEYEVFACLWLDNRHRLIEFTELFRGTIDGASVYPREVVKEALRVNAAAVIFAHNHPSGVAEPSGADRRLTERLRDALGLIDVRVLDHLIVGRDSVVAFAERGLI